MDEQKLQAQVPEEKLDEVSGGFYWPAPKYKWHFVCDTCGYVADMDCPAVPVILEPDTYIRQYAQTMHNSVKGKTKSCQSGKMVYQGTIEG